MLLDSKQEKLYIKLQTDIIKDRFSNKEKYKVYADNTHMYIIDNNCCIYSLEKQYIYLDCNKLNVVEPTQVLYKIINTDCTECEAFVTNEMIKYNKSNLIKFTDNQNKINCYYDYKFIKDLELETKSYKCYFKEFQNEQKILSICTNDKDKFITLTPVKIY